MAEQPRITLNDGNTMPQLGLGVWAMSPKTAATVVADAITVGYRSIDTAQGYENEQGVGEAIRNVDVPRDEIFVTSKLRNGLHARDLALRSFDETMRKLGLEQLDLFLIHWPVPSEDRYVEAWKTLIDLQQQGRIRSIGVSNFNEDHLERIIGETGVTPAVNQIELHPRFQQRDKRAYHRAHNIAIESWSPLGGGRAVNDPDIKRIADKHGKTIPQTIIRWHLQEGLIVIPKSANSERLRANFDVFDFALDDTEMAAVAALDNGRGRLGGNPTSVT
jgi:2,5-diketo-D-gluconate reductase A